MKKSNSTSVVVVVFAQIAIIALALLVGYISSRMFLGLYTMNDFGLRDILKETYRSVSVVSLCFMATSVTSYVLLNISYIYRLSNKRYDETPMESLE